MAKTDTEDGELFATNRNVARGFAASATGVSLSLKGVPGTAVNAAVDELTEKASIVAVLSSAT